MLCCYRLTPSYPQHHIMPFGYGDDDLLIASKSRKRRRFISVTWRNKENGAVIMRCGQPAKGFWGSRNYQDENLIRVTI